MAEEFTIGNPVEKGDEMYGTVEETFEMDMGESAAVRK